MDANYKTDIHMKDSYHLISIIPFHNFFKLWKFVKLWHTNEMARNEFL